LLILGILVWSIKLFSLPIVFLFNDCQKRLDNSILNSKSGFYLIAKYLKVNEIDLMNDDAVYSMRFFLYVVVN